MLTTIVVLSWTGKIVLIMLAPRYIADLGQNNYTLGQFYQYGYWYIPTK